MKALPPLDAQPEHAADKPLRLERGHQVWLPHGRVGMSRSAVYVGMAKGTFPRAVKISHKAMGWLSADIDAFIASRKVA